MTNIAIIPARGGSKRIPLKNLREFDGIPSITRAVRLAKSADLFERIIVSTDNAQIADLAISSGAEVPFLRSEDLSDDSTLTISVIQDVFFRAPDLSNYTYTCCIYPVTPLLESRHLQAAFLKLCSSNADYVFAGLEDKTSVYRHFEIDGEGKIKLIFPEHQSTRTQDLNKTFSDGGQFYFGRTSSWIKGVSPLSSNSAVVEFTNTEIVDIDDWNDWNLALTLISLKNREDK